MLYTYTGNTTTSVTLNVGGKEQETILAPGRTARLPENDEWVKTNVARGLLVEVETKKDNKENK
jgi:hypothetical protein